jgi:NAD(P)-dependent dehydrogenase (short-subunit alcohol dehydrogenase family)
MTNQGRTFLMAKLDGKIALITGGTTGIGAATAKLFQAEGATVIVTGSSAKTVETARADLPGIEVVVSDQADTEGEQGLGGSGESEAWPDRRSVRECGHRSFRAPRKCG